jgi:hypothetical protein
MTYIEGMFHLTRNEARTMYYWLKSKKFDADKDTFQISFDLLNEHADITVSIIQNGIVKKLAIKHDSAGERVSIDHLQIGQYTMGLSIGEEYISSFNKCLKSTVDIFPVNFSLFKGICEITFGKTIIERSKLPDISKIKIKHICDTSYADNVALLRGLKIIYPRDRVRPAFFLEEDMAILVDRIYLYGHKVHGVEIWGSRTTDFFHVYVHGCSPYDDNAPDDGWYIDAYKRLLKEYNESDCEELQDCPPMFDLSIEE